VEDPTTTAMNLTYAGTLVIGVVMFVGVAAAFVITLLLAGLGRLIAELGMALFGRRAGATVTQKPATKRRPTLKPARKEPQISPEWAAAVERADARARARAEAAAAPEVTVSVRELPAAGHPERKAS